MRAIFLENLSDYSLDSEIDYSGESLHHLVNVIRIKVNEEILILDGLGLILTVNCLAITKKNIKFRILKIENKKSFNRFCVLSKIKRDSLELAIKGAIECGVTNFIILNSQFSQNHQLNFDRLEKIAISALLQSNNPFVCKIEEINSLEDLVNRFGERLLILDNFTNKLPDTNLNMKKEDCVIVVGPEGGFSENERAFFQERNLRSISFDSPIMRAETALIAGLSYLYYS